MTAPQNVLANALQLLLDRRSPRRRSGAKRLRKLRDPSACPALFNALRAEVRDSRTWETQYQLIMALGESGCSEALGYLWELARARYGAPEPTMVDMALGDAVVRLGRRHPEDTTPVLALMSAPNWLLTDGALRAVAMLRLRLDTDAVERIVDWVSRRESNDPHRFWVAAAAAGWRGASVDSFLDQCARSPRDGVREAATASRQRRYLKWNPL
jgi:hypothetical protein